MSVRVGERKEALDRLWGFSLPRARIEKCLLRVPGTAGIEITQKPSPGSVKPPEAEHWELKFHGVALTLYQFCESHFHQPHPFFPGSNSWNINSQQRRSSRDCLDTECWPQSLLGKLPATALSCLLIKTSQELLKDLSAHFPATHTGNLRGKKTIPNPDFSLLKTSLGLSSCVRN